MRGYRLSGQQLSHGNLEGGGYPLKIPNGDVLNGP